MELQVLFVEDDEALARMVQMRLSAEYGPSIEIIHVDTLDSAVRWLTTARPDVVLLDLNLPDSKGIATFDAVAPWAGPIPIVIASATGDREMPRIAMRKGAWDYIEKGRFDPQETVERLKQAVSQAKRRKTETQSRLDEVEKEVASMDKETSSKNKLQHVKRIAKGLRSKEDLTNA